MQDHSTFLDTRRTVLAKLIYLLTIASIRPQIQLGNAVWRTAKNPRLMLYVQIIHGASDCGCLRVVLVYIDRLLLCEAIKINCPNKTRNGNKQNNSHRQTKLCVARIWANSFYLYTYLCVYRIYVKISEHI